MYEYIAKQDAEVYGALVGEEEREAKGLELIPSENYVSRAVREANGLLCSQTSTQRGTPGSGTTVGRSLPT
jgi:glycine hydroxymethyltransferase